ncbi:cobalamin-dependent protein [Candidatus Bathyarchaeota archaeon]|jgi:5-methyltetrahydrofolate--homocysteine methyltransferase|nr:cobalamin-dependent protein [Candidatus Bathyarchaeota archaeon]
MSESLVEAIADLREEDAVRLAKERLDRGEEPLSVLGDGRKGMEAVGQRFAKKEYFLPELIYSGEILKRITELSKTKLQASTPQMRRGKVVIGTVAGDIHDIGKDIVVFMLDIYGFEVHDLGVDVSADQFVQRIKEISPQVVALSGFLTLAFESMRKTVQAITDAGLRGGVKIMVGGGQIDERIREYVMADAYGIDAMSAVTLAKSWVGAL